MIPESEIHKISIENGVSQQTIEKDYIIGWFLWGIYQNPSFSQNLILKGGNCLRKIYIPNTRFSDDLDFTAVSLDIIQNFQQQLLKIGELIQKASGIEFYLEQTNVNKKDIAISESYAMDVRFYFKGFAGDSNLTMKVKFDISEFEEMILPPSFTLFSNNYSDSEKYETTIQTYSLEEILAEKLRCWIQRTRSRDLFDIVKIIRSHKIPISLVHIMSVFIKKLIFKKVQFSGKNDLLFDDKFQNVKKSWEKTIICSPDDFISADNAISIFKNFIENLFDPSVLEIFGIEFSNSDIQPDEIYSGNREAIIEAGKGRRLINIRYKNLDRIVEPYRIEDKTTEKGYFEYFYGFDRTKGNTIKSFYLHEVQCLSILPDTFEPQWDIEF